MIITFGGQIASGKTTAANYLSTKINLKVGSFATAVKNIFTDTFGVDKDFIEQWKRKEEIPPDFSMNVRKSLQLIGDGFRGIKKDVWINKTLTESKIIDDLRFINEARAVKKKNGINILLWRPGYENNDEANSEKEIGNIVKVFSKDEKEGFRQFIFFDYFIINNGTLEDLYKKLDFLEKYADI